jgi:hypothetical protein
MAQVSRPSSVDDSQGRPYKLSEPLLRRPSKDAYNVSQKHGWTRSVEFAKHRVYRLRQYGYNAMHDTRDGLHDVCSRDNPVGAETGSDETLQKYQRVSLVHDEVKAMQLLASREMLSAMASSQNNGS